MEHMDRERLVLFGSTTNESDESRRVRGKGDKVSGANYTSDPNRNGSCTEP